MAVIVTRFFRDPLFLGGLTIRVLLLFFLFPATQERWFLPFFDRFFTNPTLDPWTDFVASGGNVLSFPYGPVMFLAHLPYVAVGKALDVMLSTDFLGAVGFRLSLLAADFAILVQLKLLFPEEQRQLILFYWLSPIVFLVAYWNGQTDVVPVALLLLALVCLKKHWAVAAGAALAGSLSAKLSMAVAVPFIAIYLWRNKAIRPLILPLTTGFVAVFAIGFAVWLASPGFRVMILGNREIARLFHLALPFGDIVLYLTPILFGVALYAVWRLQRMNFELMFAVTGMSFFVLVLMTPAPVGWYLWLLPFFVAHQIGSRPFHTLLVMAFSLLVVGYHLFMSWGAAAPLLGLDFSDGLAASLVLQLTDHQKSIWITAVTLIGFVIIVQMLREGIRNNDHFRLSRRPLSIAIAGDSGSGKDTLASSLAGLFGENTIVHVAGDDYHLWDRHAPMWKALTHLNPRANDLGRFVEDVNNILDGQSIECQPYDHRNGRFRSPRLLKSNDTIIVSGLHALYHQTLVDRFDISVFLDMAEDLRRHWKIERDTDIRGHSREAIEESLERRSDDLERYIRPQKEKADLVFGLAPVNPQQLEQEGEQSLRLKLNVVIRNSIHHEKLARILIGLCGMHLNTVYSEVPGEIEMTIEGDLEPGDVALAARELAPRLAELLAIRANWSRGMTGAMQLIVLMQLESILRRRL